MAFYGTGGSKEDMKKIPSSPKYRPNGYDCSDKGSFCLLLSLQSSIIIFVQKCSISKMTHSYFLQGLPALPAANQREENVNVKNLIYGMKGFGLFQPVMKDYAKYFNLTQIAKENKMVMTLVMAVGAGMKIEVLNVHLLQV